MIALAIDIGEVRCGIAVSDATGRVALPVKVLPAIEVVSLARSFRDVLAEYEPEMLVCGSPLTLAGELGPQAERIRAEAEAIGSAADLPVAFVDERMSSREAKRILRERGCTEREMRGKLDMIAASLFLQTWLDRRNRTGR
ncbi:Holliday junction resolvase YqgF [Coriobacterium glomerans PW2]|uniref:Putative pre-16S rRNA nuclease n=1 Tax=Coriobacterium glomerans (strain ATCC 49209 / DSM 20642 / JCM 10262 / PW2) TaxID=700015 RepID=F2N800_CORGP|nr:Holliday junction resolvase RuvX [Coriobacterium glomerans]AEB07109.1 Holliday junction resolvase YqgF [Coriobacterium glomerans PW2]